jgi:hypothetical protein
MDFYSTHVFRVKKADNTNLAAGGIITCKTHHTSLCTDKNEHSVTSYVMVYKAMSHVMLPYVHEFSLTLTLVA